MGTASLAVVGGSLVAWQVYSLTSGLSKNQKKEVEEDSKLNKWNSIAYSTEPEYIKLPKESFFPDPSSDCVKAKGELRSMLKRRHWKLLKTANNAELKTHFMAISELADLAKSLSDGEMRQLAQATTLKTAVGLAARTSNPDSRFFLPPPPFRTGLSVLTFRLCSESS